MLAYGYFGRCQKMELKSKEDGFEGERGKPLKKTKGENRFSLGHIESTQRRVSNSHSHKREKKRSIIRLGRLYYYSQSKQKIVFNLNSLNWK